MHQDLFCQFTAKVNDPDVEISLECDSNGN